MDIFEQFKKENNISLDSKEIIFNYKSFEIEKKELIKFLKNMEILCQPDPENALKIEGLIKDIENITEIEELFKIMLSLIDGFNKFNIFELSCNDRILNKTLKIMKKLIKEDLKNKKLEELINNYENND